MTEDEPTTVRDDTSLRPEFVGFGVIGAMGYLIVCVLCLFVPVLVALFAGLPAIVVVAGAVVILATEAIAGVALAAVSAASPPYLTTSEFVRERISRRYGQQAARHDTLAPRHYPDIESFANSTESETAASESNEQDTTQRDGRIADQPADA